MTWHLAVGHGLGTQPYPLGGLRVEKSRARQTGQQAKEMCGRSASSCLTIVILGVRIFQTDSNGGSCAISLRGVVHVSIAALVGVTLYERL